MGEETFGELFDKFRKKQGLTQKDLADLLNVHKSTITKWKNLENKIDPDYLFKLAEILKLSELEINEFFIAARHETYLESARRYLQAQPTQQTTPHDISSTHHSVPLQSQPAVPLQQIQQAPQPTDWSISEVREFMEQSKVDLFSIDSAVVSWFCPSVELDWGWKGDQDIQFVFEPRLIDQELPEDLRKISQAHKMQYPNKKDSVRYCVSEFSIQPRDSGAQLLLTVRPVTYLTAFPIADALLTSKSDDLLRTNWFHKLQDRSHPLIPNMLIAHVLVITADNHLILQRRRADKEIDYFRGCWSASFEEHFNAPWQNYLSEDKVFSKALLSDRSIFEGLHRAVREELILSESEANGTILRILAVGFEYHNFNTALYVMAELPQPLTAERIVERLRSGEEHDQAISCSFDSDNLKYTLLDSSPPLDLLPKERREPLTWPWHPTSRMRIHLGLRRRYSKTE